MKTKPAHRLLSLLLVFWIFAACQQQQLPAVRLSATLKGTVSVNKIDGFGVNITPSQWRDGNLKPVIDRLVDDLGATLFRFDCTGLADWLDPAKRGATGRWPEEYLDSVYHSKVFLDAWETFRYLNSKGIEPIFNISGRIHPGLGFPDDPFRLADFDGYAEMAVSLILWAKEKEKLDFSFFAPFNETDLGYPEGPKITGADMLLATRAIIKKLDALGMSDIRLVAIDDSYPKFDKLEAVLSDTALVGRISAFGTHTYGNGDIGEMESWYGAETDYARFSQKIRSSSYQKASVWMTEYGDLDQTGLIEYEFAWRSTRRLMKGLRDGFNAAMAWDAFDNFHEHDTAWAVYGLLKTDTVNWTYTPKKRYYAARQVYRFVRPGWSMVEIITPGPETFDIYRTWHDPFRHLRIQAFVSSDGSDFTVLLMNGIESDVDLSVYLKDLTSGASSKDVFHYVTSRQLNCERMSNVRIKEDTLRIVLPASSISTVSTLK